MGTLAERIQNKAYEIYQKRGGEHGSDMDDWLQAEKEVMESQKKVKKPVAKKPAKPKAEKKPVVKKAVNKKVAKKKK